MPYELMSLNGLTILILDEVLMMDKRISYYAKLGIFPAQITQQNNSTFDKFLTLSPSSTVLPSPSSPSPRDCDEIKIPNRPVTSR